MWEIFLFVCAVWAVAIVGNIVLFAVEEREHRRELAEDAAYLASIDPGHAHP